MFLRKFGEPEQSFIIKKIDKEDGDALLNLREFKSFCLYFIKKVNHF